MNNLFANLPIDLSTEVTESLLNSPVVRIERIVSQGQSSADGDWYDQEENEWVVDTNVMNVPASSIIYIAGPAVKTKKIFNKMKKGDLIKWRTCSSYGIVMDDSYSQMIQVFWFACSGSTNRQWSRMLAGFWRNGAAMKENSF